MAKGSKVGWGQAKEGKVAPNTDYDHDAGQSGQSSKDLNGLYEQYQGKRLGKKS